jgi:hypothetical protein
VRLERVTRGDRLTERLLHGLVRVASGHRLPDVVRTMRYRADFFGATQMVHTQEALRGPSPWTVGERELMAAYVSALNRCRF